ncbi:hypothetical protein D1816_04065 [Aquimarina sp. AD10]|uniref:hypothetical protein n=1 Tax=Aquimarina sp. AD10 TaxID=1714849 RepID=UPI000E4F3D38|nr:hypothetical protein [Aquimarina sp. AD10]AXT59563.1 hypothetical protein D1816_04065 [Aquimarina sp. AD10]RKM92401.1 hypothetical protein D7033_21040 [Aquimarina sp. AD10]
MKTKLFFLISVFILSYTTVFAQTKISAEKNNLEFLIGYNSGALKNLIFAPVRRYDYNALNYQFGYTRITKREKLFEVQLNYLSSALETNIIAEPNPEYSKIVLNFSSLKQIHKSDKFKIHVGLQTQTNVSSYFDWKQYDFQQKLGIAGRFTYLINDTHSLSSKLTLPFIMWRTSTFEENLYTINRYQSVLWSTEYKYRISKHLDFKVNYNFNYDRLQISNAYRELQHQVNLGINFKF